MSMSFLNYYKMVLEKVSFDHRLFRKEYEKALRSLKAEEIKDLQQWLERTGMHKQVKSPPQRLMPLDNNAGRLRN